MQATLPRPPNVYNDPPMPDGDAITRWTVRLALAAYVVAAAMLARSRRADGAARIAWTLGCLAFLAHVAAAFHYFHAWSHAHALRETARQTHERFGIDWGGGLWLNYVFTIAWLADAAWWWSVGHQRYAARARWITLALHAFLAFMWLNAVIVFPTGWIRWAGVAAGVVLLAVWALLKAPPPVRAAGRRDGSS